MEIQSKIKKKKPAWEKQNQSALRQHK